MIYLIFLDNGQDAPVPVGAVARKNCSPLEHLRTWLSDFWGENSESGRFLLVDKSENFPTIHAFTAAKSGWTIENA